MDDPTISNDSSVPSPANPDPKQPHALERGALLRWANPMLNELVQRYPYMFKPPHSGLYMLAGWYPVFEQLCADIDAQLGEHKRGFHWDQLKTHEGAARWYWVMGNMADRPSAAIVGLRVWRHAYDIAPDDAVRSAVRLLIMQAIAKTPTLCMACGRPGTGQPNTDAHLVCCDEHGELLGRRPADFLALVHSGVQQAGSVLANGSTPCAASQAGSQRCAPEP